MDEAQYHLREATDDDLPATVRIANLLNPEAPIPLDMVQHWDAVLRTPPSSYRSVVVERRSDCWVVAQGSVGTIPDGPDPNYLWIEVIVDPAHAGLGIGRYVAEELERGARRAPDTTLVASVRASDPRGMAFFQQQGFRERRRRWRSWLDLPAPGLASFPQRAASLAREGFEFTTLAEEGPERPEVRQRLFRLVMSVLEDEPRIVPFVPSSFEQFVRFNLEGPGFLPEAFFLARQGDRYVALSNLETTSAEATVLRQILTGTLRELRGRGLATELKRRTVEYGETHGFRAIRTNNDSLNHPMWAINAKLGFHRELEYLEGDKTLRGSGPAHDD